MARVVCQVLPQKTQWTLLWSEGPASFPPYVLQGATLAELQRVAEQAHQQLAVIAANPGDTGAAASAGRALAQAGHALYRLLFQLDQAGPAAGHEVHTWLQGLLRDGAVEQLEIIGNCFAMPWAAIYDRPADQAALHDAEAWMGFWGCRFPILGGRRVQWLRERQLPEKPVVVAAIDAVARAALPAEEQQRLNEFLTGHELTVVDSLANLARVFQAQPVDILYVFGRADSSAVRLGNDHLTAEALDAMVHADKEEEPAAPTLFFFNACADGVASNVLSAFERFNAMGIIGTMQPLAAALASRCGLEMLEDLAYNGRTVAEASAALRQREPLAGALYFVSCPGDLQAGGASEGRNDREPLGLPDLPYQPLAPLNEDAAAMLVAREADVARVAGLLDQAGVGLVLVHGAPGVGKASLVRAGVVPYLEESAIGYQFLRQRAEGEGEGEPDEQERDFPVMAIRASSDLAGQLAIALLEFCGRPYAYVTPAGNTVTVDLPAILNGFVQGPQEGAESPDDELLPSADDLRIALRHEPQLLGQVLAAITASLPFELVLLIEQAEEVFSLAKQEGDADDAGAALTMLRAALAQQPRAKFIMSLRTEYLGRFVDPLLQTAEDGRRLRGHLVRHLSEDDLVDVLLQPTSEEPLPGSDLVPQEKYGFQFEQGVAEQIAGEARRAASGAQESPLALVQVIGARLYSLIRQRQNKVVRAADLRAIGGVRDGLRTYTGRLLTSMAGGRDLKALKSLLARLIVRQPDGSVTRDLVFEDTAARQWLGATPLGTVLFKATADESRLLEVNYLNVDGQEGNYLSLSHDALAPVLARQAEEDAKQSHTRSKIQDVLWITVPLLILLGVMSAVLFARRSTSVVGQDAEIKKANEAIADMQARVAGSRWPGYVGQLQTAQQAFQAGDLPRARQALMSVRPVLEPNIDDMDPRGFEWQYLWHQLHRDLLTLPGHEGTVNAVALTDDGFTLATACGDGSIRVLDALTGRDLARFEHKDKKAGLCLEFVPKGGLLAAGYEDGAILFWKVERTDFAFAPNAAALVASLAPASGDFVTPLGQFAARGLSPAVVHPEPADHKAAVASISFHPDGKTLASAGKDGTVKIWDLTSTTPKLTKTLDKHEGGVTAVAYSPKGEFLASAGADKKVVVWDTKKYDKQATLEGHPAEVAAVAWSLDGKTLATAGTQSRFGLDSGLIKLWDAASWKENKAPDFTVAPLFAVAFSHDGKKLVTAGKDSAIRFLDVATGQESPPLRGHLGWVRSLGMARGGSVLASGSYDTTAKVWKSPDMAAPDRLKVAAGPVLAVVFSPDDHWLATGSSDGSIKLWNPATGAEIKSIKAHDKAVRALAWAGEGKWLVSGGADGQLKLWDVDPASKSFGTELDAVADAHQKEITAIDWPPTSNRFASASLDGTAKIWKVTKGKIDKEPLVAKSDSPVLCLAYAISQGIDLLATGHEDNNARLWNGATAKPLEKPGGKPPVLIGHTGPVTAISIVILLRERETNRGIIQELVPWPVTGSVDKTVIAWTLAKFEIHDRTHGHGGPVTCMVTGRTQNHTLVTGSTDQTVKLWEPRMNTMEQRWTFLPELGVPRVLALSTDNRTLAVAGQDGTVRLFRTGKIEAKAK